MTEVISTGNAKKPPIPEVIAIYAATESGLVGKTGGPNGMPWSFFLDFKWFQKWTMHWPMVFGKNTAFEMAKTKVGFPLPNRQCAIITKSLCPGINLWLNYPNRENDDFTSGPKFYRDVVGTITFHKGGYAFIFPDLQRAIKHFRSDKIFIGGGVQIFNLAADQKISYPEYGISDKPLIDTVIKTEFSDNIYTGPRVTTSAADPSDFEKIQGDAYFDDSNLLKDFYLKSVQELELLDFGEACCDYKYKLMRIKEFDENEKRIETTQWMQNMDDCILSNPNAPYEPKPNDTLPVTVKFMVYSRKKEITL